MMDNTLAIALSATAAGVLSPLMLSWLNNRHLREAEERRDKRQDEVAERALAAAEKAEAKTDEVARLLAESNVQAAEVARAHGDQLVQIHTLVNSNMTAEMQRGLTSHKSLLAVLIKFTPEESQQIEDVTKLIAELEAQLVDRFKQTQAADAAVKQ